MGYWGTSRTRPSKESCSERVAGGGIRFDDAWREALAIASDVADGGADVVLIRDLLGRATVLVSDSEDRPYPAEDRAAVERRMRERCTPFVGERPVMVARELFTPQALTDGPDIWVLREADSQAGHGRLAILERGVVGRE